MGRVVLPPFNPNAIVVANNPGTGGSDQAFWNHGPFYPDSVDLGHFLAEFWYKCDQAGGTNIMSDGHGGAHALLIQALLSGGLNQLAGNINKNDGATQTLNYGSFEGPQDGEPAYGCVRWDGSNLYTDYNGIIVGKTAFTGPRRSTSLVTAGGGVLYIGSAGGHQTFHGSIPQFRLWEEFNPLQNLGDAAHRPEKIFSYLTSSDLVNFTDCSFLANYMGLAAQRGHVEDLSRNGYTKPVGGNGGLAGKHPGFRAGWALGVGGNEQQGWPQLRAIIDNVWPFFISPTAPVETYGKHGSPKTAPSGFGTVYAYDSFQRANRTPVYPYDYLTPGVQNDLIGTTEVGGFQWKANPFGASGNTGWRGGIINGRYVPVTLGDGSGAHSFIDIASTGLGGNYRVTCLHVPSGQQAYGVGGATGVFFRGVAGSENSTGFVAFRHGNSVAVFRLTSAFGNVGIVDIAIPSSSVGFTIRCSGNTIQVLSVGATYDGNGNITSLNETQQGSDITDSNYTTGTQVGIAQDFDQGAVMSAGANCLSRTEHFIVRNP